MSKEDGVKDNFEGFMLDASEDYVNSGSDEDGSDSGFGSSLNAANVRLMNRDGSLNVRIKGVDRWMRLNLYKQLVKLSTLQFYIALSVIYVLLNLIFSICYFLIGYEGLTTPDQQVTFFDAFFFSTQTFTTLGYGHISPSSLSANILASFEAFVGLLYFAVATGLVYGRFSNSRADVRFSKNILITDDKEVPHLVLRLANVSITELSDLHADLIISWIEISSEKPIRRYRKLPLEIDRISLLTTSWTIVHKINADSPCKIINDISSYTGLEFMVFLSAFDEVFDQKVKVRTSYIEEDLIKNAYFIPITSYEQDMAVVDLDKLNSFVQN